jgi:hypothetical protein
MNGLGDHSRVVPTLHNSLAFKSYSRLVFHILGTIIKIIAHERDVNGSEIYKVVDLLTETDAAPYATWRFTK